jgi:2,3-bisphosphoglycerate-independent phosphoglycerate mutase
VQLHFDQLARKSDSRILLVVLDGLGGLPRGDRTELEAAATPNLDRQARHSALGCLIPVEQGITPGSGPAHVSLFGYDPVEFQVGRGVLECLGVGLDPGPKDLCARANFANISGGVIADRRAKKENQRMATALCQELCAGLQKAIPCIGDVKVVIRSGEEHRFAVMFQGPGLGEKGLNDSDPGHEHEAPEEVKSSEPDAQKSARLANEFIRLCGERLAGRAQANGVLLRGLGLAPVWPSMAERFKLKPACIAAYPMYRGLARLVGMSILPAGSTWESGVETLALHKSEHDFFFLHLKELDKAGEDGDFDRKVELIERFDEEILPQLLGLGFDVLCITGDHSTPAVMRSHSWHYVPVMLHSGYVRPQVSVDHFGERDCLAGSLGRLYSKQLMAVLLAHAGKLGKFGA